MVAHICWTNVIVAVVFVVVVVVAAVVVGVVVVVEGGGGAVAVGIVGIVTGIGVGKYSWVWRLYFVEGFIRQRRWGNPAAAAGPRTGER